ncbi:MAG: APC family permease [Ilumatobacteraceae bacterium]
MIEVLGSTHVAGERSKLRRELRRLDTIFFLISAMVAVDTIGAIAIGGAQAFTWLLVLFATFFVPSALASAELGAAIPEEGGAYAWVRAAFGRFAGALTSLFYWVATPTWLGGSLTVVGIAVFEAFHAHLSMTGKLLFGVLFIAGATIGAIVPLRIGKWLPSSGAIGQICLLSFFTVSTAVFGARHGFHGIAAGHFAPSFGVFIAIVPILIYSFVGIELPSTAAEEMIDPRRDLPVAIVRAGLSQLLMYALPILAVVVVLPVDRLTSLHGLIDAMKSVFTVYGGSIDAGGAVTLTGLGNVVGIAAGAVFIWVLFASGTAWIMGAGRTQAAACLDGAGPRMLGRVSARTGVPVVMGLVSGGVAIVTMVAILLVTNGDAQKYFSVGLTVAVGMIVIAYVLIFPAFVTLRIRRPELPRPFRVPGGLGVAWLISIVATGWAMLATVCLLWPGIGTANPDAALPVGFEGERATFELLVLTPVAAMLPLCAVLYALGHRRP